MLSHVWAKKDARSAAVSRDRRGDFGSHYSIKRPEAYTNDSP